jgi:hypothetical protein
MKRPLDNPRIVVEVGCSWWSTPLTDVITEFEAWMIQAKLEEVAYAVDLRLVWPGRTRYVTLRMHERDTE